MPTHPIEGSDYKAGSGALAGERVYGNADPATAFSEYEANALYHGLRNVVKAEQISGDLTAASGAADQAEGFVRLGKALRRAARRLQSGNLQQITVNASPLTFSVPPDVVGFMLVDASPTPLAAESLVHPDPASNGQNKNRFIFVLNQTTAFRLVGHGFSGRYMRLPPGEGCWLYGVDDTGSNNTFWTPIGELDDAPNGYHTFNAKWYSNFSTPEATAAFDMFYMRHGPGRRLITINYPTSQFTLGEAASAMRLASSDGFANTPGFLWTIQNILTDGYAPYLPIPLKVGGVNEIGYLSCGDGNIYVQRMAGNFPAATVIFIIATSLTYITEHP